MRVFNRTLTLVVLVFLAVGMGSANLLDSFGVVSGEAGVEGPTFYPAAGEDLMANEEPSDPRDTIPEATLDDESLDNYEIQGLESAEWYPKKIDFTIAAEIESDDNAVQVDAIWRASDGENKESYCVATIGVDSEDKEPHRASCEGELDDGQVDRESLEGFEVEYNVIDGEIAYKSFGDTRVEVNAQ